MKRIKCSGYTMFITKIQIIVNIAFLEVRETLLCWHDFYSNNYYKQEVSAVASFFLQFLYKSASSKSGKIHIQQEPVLQSYYWSKRQNDKCWNRTSICTTSQNIDLTNNLNCTKKLFIGGHNYIVHFYSFIFIVPKEFLLM